MKSEEVCDLAKQLSFILINIRGCNIRIQCVARREGVDPIRPCVQSLPEEELTKTIAQNRLGLVMVIADCVCFRIVMVRMTPRSR